MAVTEWIEASDGLADKKESFLAPLDEVGELEMLDCPSILL